MYVHFSFCPIKNSIHTVFQIIYYFASQTIKSVINIHDFQKCEDKMLSVLIYLVETEYYDCVIFEIFFMH